MIKLYYVCLLTGNNYYELEQHEDIEKAVSRMITISLRRHKQKKPCTITVSVHDDDNPSGYKDLHCVNAEYYLMAKKYKIPVNTECVEMVKHTKSKKRKH